MSVLHKLTFLPMNSVGDRRLLVYLSTYISVKNSEIAVLLGSIDYWVGGKSEELESRAKETCKMGPKNETYSIIFYL